MAVQALTPSSLVLFTLVRGRGLLGSTRAGIGINLLLSIAGEHLSEARCHTNDHNMLVHQINIYSCG